MNNEYSPFMSEPIKSTDAQTVASLGAATSPVTPSSVESAASGKTLWISNLI